MGRLLQFGNFLPSQSGQKLGLESWKKSQRVNLCFSPTELSLSTSLFTPFPPTPKPFHPISSSSSSSPNPITIKFHLIPSPSLFYSHPHPYPYEARLGWICWDQHLWTEVIKISMNFLWIILPQSSFSEIVFLWPPLFTYFPESN